MGYRAKEVSDTGLIGLFWKRTPTRTCFPKEEWPTPGSKAAKSQVTVISGGNTNRYYKLKHLVIHQAQSANHW